MILTYNKCQTMFKQARSCKLLNNGMKACKLDNHTYLTINDDDTYSVRLWDTDIIIVSEKSWTLNSNGWRTRLTGDRLNKFSPIHVYSIHREWYYNMKQGNQVYSKDKLIPFYDGLIIDAVHIFEALL